VPYFLSKYDPDALRFYLTAVAPETRDTEFSWEDFVERNNNELVATWGNLANRMLSFAYKRFDGQVPEPGELDGEDRALLAKVEAGFETVGDLYNACKFRAALGECLGLAREANGYLATHPRKGVDRKAPWFQIKEDRQAAATTVYVVLRVIDNLKTLISPVLPHSAQEIHEYLATHPRKGVGYDGQLFGTQQVVEYEEEARSHRALTYDHSGAVGTWAPSTLPALKGAFGSGAGAAPAGAVVQEAGRERDGRVECAVGRTSVKPRVGFLKKRSQGVCPGSCYPKFRLTSGSRDAKARACAKVCHKDRNRL
jgi:methionyl-tRNA synthetase